MFELCYRSSLLECMTSIHDVFLTFACTIGFFPVPDRKTKRIREELAAKRIRDEVFVEGNTFHEYSTAINSRILGYAVSDGLTRNESD